MTSAGSTLARDGGARQTRTRYQPTKDLVDMGSITADMPGEDEEGEGGEEEEMDEEHAYDEEEVVVSVEAVQTVQAAEAAIHRDSSSSLSPTEPTRASSATSASVNVTNNTKGTTARTSSRVPHFLEMVHNVWEIENINTVLGPAIAPPGGRWTERPVKSLSKLANATQTNYRDWAISKLKAQSRGSPLVKTTIENVYNIASREGKTPGKVAYKRQSYRAATSQPHQVQTRTQAHDGARTTLTPAATSGSQSVMLPPSHVPTEASAAKRGRGSERSSIPESPCPSIDNEQARSTQTTTLAERGFLPSYISDQTPEPEFDASPVATAPTSPELGSTPLQGSGTEGRQLQRRQMRFDRGRLDGLSGGMDAQMNDCEEQVNGHGDENDANLDVCFLLFLHMSPPPPNPNSLAFLPLQREHDSR